MFIEYFGFKHNPFSLANGASFFDVDTDRKTLCKQILGDLYKGHSPILLIGEPGAQSHFMQYLTANLPSNTQRVTPIDSSLSYAARVLMGIDVLLEKCPHDKKLLLIVDNAHEIPATDLNFLLLLPKHHAKNTKSLQMIWCGSAELESKLLGVDHKKYTDYAYRYQLDGLDVEQITRYISFRLEQVGYSSEMHGELFSSAAINKIAALSQGSPQSINVLCSGSLILASRNRQNKICERLVEEASTLCLTPVEPVKILEDKIYQDYTLVRDHTDSPPEKISICIQLDKSQHLEHPSELTKHDPPPLTNQGNAPARQSLCQSIAQLFPIKHKGFYAGSLVVIGLCLVDLASFQNSAKTVDNLQPAKNLDTTIETQPEATPGQPLPISVQMALGASPQNEPVVLSQWLVLAPLAASEIHNAKILDTPTQPKADIAVQPVIADQVKPLTQPKYIKALPIESRVKSESSKVNSVYLAQLKTRPHKLWALHTPGTNIVLASIDPFKSAQQASKVAKLKTRLQRDGSNKFFVMAKQNTSQALKHKTQEAPLPQQSWPMVSPVIDAQEAAARDRAANRLKLDRLGVEFSGDSLIQAAHNGDLPVVKLLIAGGVPPNIKNHNGQTALMVSVKNGYKHIIKELLKNKSSS
jgi:type II secretory pathway predicted ATPase ExeA